MRNSITLALVSGLFSTALLAQVGDRAEIDKSAPPAHWKLPPTKLLSVDESLASFDLPADFRMELVATEPLVQDPVAIQFDERGRLWVIEWPGYNWELRKIIPGLDLMATPNARIVILEDTDGDGRMDRRTVFMDHAAWSRGIQVAGNGAVVLRLPQILFAQDANGDGVADREDTIVTGLEVPVNPHGAQSNLFRAMDNWIYGSSFPERLRKQRDTWTRQPSVRSRGQWGISQDNYGRMFYASNGDHLRGDLVPPHYFARNPSYAATAGIDVRFPSDQTTWPPAGTPGVNRRAHLRDDDGTLQVFTANTAPCVYRGDQFPAEFVGNVFLGEAAGRFIRRSVLTETDGEMTAQNAYARREFAFSRDERFRPVFTTNGPDGTLYFADMHRGIIEGDIFVTSYLRNQIVERKLQHPFHGLGRIYRLVHQGRPRQTPPAIAKDEMAAWIERLAHPNGFWRDTAQRVLVERGDQRVIAAVRKMALEHTGELARLHALWTLEGLAALEPAIVLRALEDASPKLRVAALRVAEPLLADAAVARAVLRVANDVRLEVRRQLMFTLGEAKTAEFENAMLALLRTDADKPVAVEAAVSGLRDQELAFLERLLSAAGWREERPGAPRLVSALAQAIGHSGNEAAIGKILELVGERAGNPRWIRIALLEGLAAGQKRLEQLPAALAALENSADETIRARAGALKKVWTAPAAVAANARALSGEQLERGKMIYALCGACHGPEGKGQPAIAPPLEGSAIVAGPPEELLRAILLGRNLDRANKAYPDMPSLAGLPDEDLAAVASYVRARWGPPSRPIPLGRVRQARTEFNVPATPAPAAPKQ